MKRFISILLLSLTTMIAVPSYGEQGSWVVKSGNPGEVKVCRISKQLDDGVIMLEYSNLFQGLAIISESAASLTMKEKGEYGYAVTLWSDEHPAANAFTWHDLRGIYISFTQGKWINMWNYIVKNTMLHGEELRISVGHEGGWPNKPNLTISLEGFRKAFGEFTACVEKEWN